MTQQIKEYKSTVAKQAELISKLSRELENKSSVGAFDRSLPNSAGMLTGSNSNYPSQ